jgi:hypothetical protein
MLIKYLLLIVKKVTNYNKLYRTNKVIKIAKVTNL